MWMSIYLECDKPFFGQQDEREEGLVVLEVVRLLVVQDDAFELLRRRVRLFHRVGDLGGAVARRYGRIRREATEDAVRVCEDQENQPKVSTNRPQIEVRA